jgi:hypothetical protein
MPEVVTTFLCRDFPLQMWLLFSGELSAAEEKFWQAHLQSCTRCREVFADAQAVQEQYARLPLVDAPERVVQKIIRPAQPQRRLVWWELFAPRLSLFFDLKPRLAFAGVAFAVLILSFHYLAFQQPNRPAWEATAFDEKADELSIALMKYNANEVEAFGRDEQAAQFSWDARAADLRAGIAALESELQNSKL